jgi:tetratricopeptide (TPR) repeat protein
MAAMPALSRILLAPLAVFGAVLAAMVALNTGAPSPPALSAGGDIGRPSGNPVRDAKAAVRAAPDSASARAALAGAYLVRARETGDASLYAGAERAVDAALRRDPRDVGALVGAATLAGLRHDFRGQLRYGLDAARVAPQLASPLTVVADAQLELGRYGDAARSAQRLVNLKPGLPAYARVSYYRELTGDPAGAVRAMRLAASAGGSAQSAAYVRALLGDLELARGHVDAARSAYSDALRDVPSYPQALTGLARIDAAGGDLDRAAARLRRSTRRLPLTTSLTLLGEVELAAGRRRAAAVHLGAAREMHAADVEGGGLPDAEAVLFEANHGSPAKAVELGRSVFRRAPSIRSADALGWALTRAGEPARGFAWARRALRTGSRDPMFRAHAAVAARRAGRLAAAARHERMALRGAPALSPTLRTLMLTKRPIVGRNVSTLPLSAVVRAQAR